MAEKPIIKRDQILNWCKKRALEYVNRGEFDQAFNSFASDLRKERETKDVLQLVLTLGMQLKMNGHLDNKKDMTDWIEEFE